MTKLSVFITLFTTTYVRQQYKGSSFLPFRGNSYSANVPQCYVKCTLSAFFMSVM